MMRSIFILFISIIFFNNVNAQLCSGSLGSTVVNIDFGSGTGRGAALGSSFTSYTYSASGFPLDGYYTITNSTAGLLNSWWSTYDHDYQTTGITTGYMMIVNASLSITDYFFKDTVTGLCAGTSYQFAAWVLNLFNNGNTVYPDLTFSIYDATSGTILGTYNIGDIVGSTTAVDWEQCGLCFTATTNSVVLKITNNKAGAAPGNDLALDDITFRPYGGTITASLSDGSVSKDVCLGAANALKLISSFASATSKTAYQWQVSANNGTTWSDITGATSSTYMIKDITVAGTYLYRIATAEGSNINSTSCRVLSDTITVNVKAYTAASLPASYINCSNYTFNFKNENSSSDVAGYVWAFGDGNTSTTATPTHTYTDTGSYLLRLKVTNSNGCSDSVSSTVKVYPGFSPAFTVTGECYLSPFYFADATYAKYGSADSWLWNFGDASSTTDTSTKQNTFYTYSSAGTKTATLTVTTTKGCSGTVTKPVTVTDKPDLSVAFNDTLICSIDTLQLKAIGTGTFTWTGNNIINAGTATPSVYPKDTSQYIVTLTNKGCVASDTVTVNVVEGVTLSLQPTDTTICTTDTIHIQTTSNALHYQWTPSSYISSDTAKEPLATPLTATTYNVTATIGKCSMQGDIIIKTVPYPSVIATGDTSICYGSTAQLKATITASSFTWSPTNSLLNENTLTPIAGPTDTTTYVITAYDTLGCPKPSSDSVTVNVAPKVKAFAGNDTSVVVNEPLQLNATGGTNYVWLPATDLSSTIIYNPIGVYNASVDSITYTVKVSTPAGCYGYDDITVVVYKTPADIFVPTAFTPNADGLNDVEKPTLVGIKTLNYFSVYNRWGQRIFYTSQQGKGWDGTLNGIKQPSGTYVFIALGTDYLGKQILRKGTFVLIR